jgi:hypothetical protein
VTEKVVLRVNVSANIVKTMGIKVNYNATVTPRANGQAGNYNRTILNALSASTDDEK